MCFHSVAGVCHNLGSVLHDACVPVSPHVWPLLGTNSDVDDVAPHLWPLTRLAAVPALSSGEVFEHSPPGFCIVSYKDSPTAVTTTARLAKTLKPRAAKRAVAGPVPTANNAAAAKPPAAAVPLPVPTRLADIPAGVNVGKLVGVLEALHVLRPVLGTNEHAHVTRECQLPVATPLVTSLLDGVSAGNGPKGRLGGGLKGLMSRLVTAVDRDWNGGDDSDEDDDEAAGLLDAPAAWARVETCLTELLTSAEDGSDEDDGSEDGSASEQADAPAPRRVTRQQAAPPPSNDTAAALVAAARGGPGWVAACRPELKVECLHWLCCEALESNAFRQALHNVEADAKETAKEAAKVKSELKAAQAAAREAARHLKELSSAENTAPGSDAQRRAAIAQAKKAAGAAASKAEHLQAGMKESENDDVEESAAAAAALMRVTSLVRDASGRQYWRLRCLEKAGLLGVSWSAGGAVEEWGTYDAAQASRAANALRPARLGTALAAWVKVRQGGKKGGKT